MIVVGGTYRELCANPVRHLLRGSGLRAAAALSSSHERPTLHSAVEESAAEEAGYVAGGLGVEAVWTQRSESIRFGYFTPLSAPTIDGRLSRLSHELTSEGETALVFGMVEAPPGSVRVSANRLILDPQQPRDLVALDLNSFHYGELAIVANRAETLALGGGGSLQEAAARLLDQYGAAVVVTKLAARGSLVTTRDDQQPVGPFPTRTVWPIGSGDIFAAAFALYWGQRNYAPLEAAREASRWTAHWCVDPDGEVHLGGDPNEYGALDELGPLDPGDERQAYLAGPFFNLAQRWLVDLVRDSLRDLGGGPFSPFHDVGLGDSDVARRDLEGLRASASMLALLDGADAGTLFEAGYATAIGIPVVGYAETPDPEGWKMLEGTGAELHDDLSTASYRAVWAGMGMTLEPS